MNERAESVINVAAGAMPLARLDSATFERAIENSFVATIVVDATDEDLPILYANQAFARLTGYRIEEVLGRNCRFLQGKDTDASSVEALVAAFREGVEASCELLNYRKDGSAFWNAISISPVTDGGGNVSFFFGYQQDVSPRREAEEALAQAMKLEAVGKLTGGVAHDFNNIMQVVTSAFETISSSLSDEHKTPRLNRMIDIGLSATERGAMLTKQLLAFSMKQRLEVRVLSATECVMRLSSVLHQALGDEVQTELQLDQNVWLCEADPTQLETTILNLAINSRDAMHASALRQLTVSTANRELSTKEGKRLGIAEGRYVEIGLLDTGCGIPLHLMARVLEPFFTTKAKGTASGLGLSTAYGFARQCGGTLYLESTPDLGTHVHLLIPAVDRPPGHLVAVESVVPGRPPQMRILVVDDRKEVAEMTQLCLEFSGYDVDVAYDAKEALTLIESGNIFQLLLTDIVMPGELDGIGLARRVVNNYPGIKVLLMTGFTGEGDDSLDIEFPVIRKPFGQEDLRRRVAQLISETRASNGV